MKQIFHCLILLLYSSIYSDSIKNEVNETTTQTIYYPLNQTSSVKANRYYDEEGKLEKIVFGKYPNDSQDNPYALKYFYKPNQSYIVKEFGRDRKLKFTHKFEKVKDGWLFKGYYRHNKKEKIQSSKIRYHVLKYNFSGQIIHESYYDKFHELTPNDAGIAIYSFVYDTKGNLIQKVTMDWKKRVHPDTDGIGIRNFTYDEKNRLSSKTFFRKEGVPKAIEGNVSKVEYTYNEGCYETRNKRKEKEIEVSLSGNFIHHQNSGFLISNCIESIKSFQFSKEAMGYLPAEDKFGVHSYSFKFEEKCLLDHFFIFACVRPDITTNPLGENILYPHPYLSLRYESNQEITDFIISKGEIFGTVIGTIEMDREIKTVTTKAFNKNKESIAVYGKVFKVIEKFQNNNRVYWENLGADGKFVAMGSGISKAISKFDENGNWIYAESYWINDTYNSTGSYDIKRINQYDSNCLNLKKEQESCLSLEEEYDNQDNFLDKDNGSYPKIVNHFNSEGEVFKKEFFIRKNEKEVTLSHLENIEYDPQCLKINTLNKNDCFTKKIFKGTRDRLSKLNIVNQFQKFKNGVLVYRANYDYAGKFTNESNGFYKLEKKIDEKGNIKEVKYFYPKKDKKYEEILKLLDKNNNERDRTLLEKFYRNSFGDTIIKSFNAKSNLIEQITLNSQGKEIEKEVFGSNKNLVYSVYSIYMQSADEKLIKIRLDQFKRPVEVEFNREKFYPASFKASLYE